MGQNWEVLEINRTNLNLADSNSVSLWIKKNSNLLPDLIVCNAAGNDPKELKNLSASDFRFWLENNFLGHVEIIQSVIGEMGKRGSGSIVFISSAFAVRSKKGRSQYSVSKAAQDAYMRSLALEFAPLGIKVNSVSPGFINTELTKKNNSPDGIKRLIEGIPVGRLGEPEEVAKLVAFLSSDLNTYITGQNIAIDGGFSLQ